jgi:hypothetical protein
MLAINSLTPVDDIQLISAGADFTEYYSSSLGKNVITYFLKYINN